MSDEYQLEVPDFARCWPFCDDSSVCNQCFFKSQNPVCNVATGRTVPGNVPNSPNATCACHDICVEEVTHISTTVVNRTLPYPPVARCRIVLPEGSTFPTLTPNVVGQVVVTCAEEELDPGCGSITVKVGLMLIFPSGQGAIALPICLPISVNQNNTYDFETCTVVGDFDQMRRIISQTDGSCIKIALRAQANATGDAIILKGKIIDKLWRHENLWVMAVQPYPDIPNFAQFTVKTEFNTFNHAFGNCTSSICP